MKLPSRENLLTAYLVDMNSYVLNWVNDHYGSYGVNASQVMADYLTGMLYIQAHQEQVPKKDHHQLNMPWPTKAQIQTAIDVMNSPAVKDWVEGVQGHTEYLSDLAGYWKEILNSR